MGSDLSVRPTSLFPCLATDVHHVSGLSLFQNLLALYTIFTPSYCQMLLIRAATTFKILNNRRDKIPMQLSRAKATLAILCGAAGLALTAVLLNILPARPVIVHFASNAAFLDVLSQ